MADLVAYAKANPGKLNYGYFNASSQVPSAVLGEKARLDWQGIAYKAIGNAWTDLYAGAIQFMFVDLTARLGRRRQGAAAGDLAARAQPALSRRAGTERELPSFVSTGFLAIAVPKATPDDIKQRLNELINEAIFSPDINKRLVEEFALAPHKLDRAQCAQQDREERARWADYVTIAKIDPQ